MTLQLVIRSSEVKLMQMLNELRAATSGWQACHFHLSELLEEYQSEYQVKIAINLIHDLLKTYDGNIFLLGDNSIMLLCKAVEPSIRDKLIFQLRYLYMDDPLAYTTAGQENPAFCTVYDLRRQWQEFFEMCSRRMTAFARKQPMAVQPAAEKNVDSPGPRLPVIERENPAPPVHAPAGELSASKLAMIERDVRYADMIKVIRRQPVCAVLPDMKVRRVFDELYIHIAHLRQLMKSDVDFLSNRWLFKYLTHLLDEKMLGLLRSSPGRYLDSPISLNLNVETLLSSHFQEFDALVKPETKVAIIIEVPVVDVFADMTAFILARSEIQKLGYRVCLDGLTTASFASINREKLGLDLVKVQWNASAQGDLQTGENRAMQEAVQAAGGNRVILCRCDNRSAVEYGQALGISLFQGRYLDSVLNPTAKLEN